MWWLLMGKFFFAPNERTGQLVKLSGNTAHHIINVLRMRIGQEYILCDGNGTDFNASLESVGDKPFTATFKLFDSNSSKNEPPCKITLYQGLPKGDKMDWIIEKCTEAGIHKIVPVITSRTVIKVKDVSKMKDRYMRISESAASQSMRGIIPSVSAPIDFADVIKHSNNNICLVAFENENQETIKSTLLDKPANPINLWVGPEGGFEDSEIKSLTDIGAIPVSLGPRILRTETAGLVALAQILCIWE